MRACMGSTVRKTFDVVYKESNKGAVVISFGFALPASPTFRRPCTSVNALDNGKSPGGVETLPKVESPYHKALLKYLSSYR